MSLTTDFKISYYFFQLIQYIEYYLKKEDRHSLQSPFSYQVYQGLRNYWKEKKNQFSYLEQKRRFFLEDNSKIRFMDLGAGSYRFPSKERKIKDIMDISCSSQKYSLLYQYFCSLTPANTVIELGTCLGLNTCYLAEATNGTIYSFEGAEELVYLANNNVKSYQNIQLIVGDISETLPNFLIDNPKVDFAFIDANHTYKNTIIYFKQIMAGVHQDSIIVIGDIHWSKGMNQAWKEIIASEKVRLSLDFYECGVIIFKEGLEKNHHVLHY